jgi:hypothetical protein
MFVHGIRITDGAERQLTQGGRIPLSVHDYTTTGGVTLILDNSVYINAPFDDSFCQEPEATLFFDSSNGYFVSFRGKEIPARILALPGYLHATDSQGRPVTYTVFSHADRVRVSPIYGCTMSCKFCDIPGNKYVRRPLEQLLEGLNIAMTDSTLPVYHILITGGSPSPRDFEYFDRVCAGIIGSVHLPVDLMMPPRPKDFGFVDRLADMGIRGFSINLEVFGEEASKKITPEKHRIGLGAFAKTIERAVQRTGGADRVRSLVVVGLESEEKTLDAVHFLARLGCDPVLSPFRPTRGTALSGYPVPSYEFLERVYLESVDIVERYGVKLGPRCIPCQHNTLTFPDNSGAYYFSAEK